MKITNKKQFIEEMERLHPLMKGKRTAFCKEYELDVYKVCNALNGKSGDLTFLQLVLDNAKVYCKNIQKQYAEISI